MDVAEHASELLRSSGAVGSESCALPGEQVPVAAGREAEVEALAERVGVGRVEQTRRGPTRRALGSVCGVRSSGCGAAVPQLLELHRELDVGERAAAELQVELRVVARRDPFALDAGLHPTDLSDPFVGEVGPVHEGFRRREEPGTEVCVAGGEPGLDEGLELPGQRPLLPVVAVPTQ